MAVSGAVSLSTPRWRGKLLRFLAKIKADDGSDDTHNSGQNSGDNFVEIVNLDHADQNGPEKKAD